VCVMKPYSSLLGNKVN